MTDDQLLTAEDYFANNGWSSRLFLPHARMIASRFRSSVEIEVYRDRVLLRRGGIELTLRVHHAGRSEEYLTVLAAGDVEIRTFRYTVAPELVTDFLDKQLEGDAAGAKTLDIFPDGLSNLTGGSRERQSNQTMAVDS